MSPHTSTSSDAGSAPTSEAPTPRKVPTSTYRLQITDEFDLIAAARQLEYLQALGVDWVYLSPILAAEPGSSHGYDVVAPDRIDPSRGGSQALATLSAQARRLGMGVLVDIVPNHVGVATPAHKSWWWDVLRLGRESEHAQAFDVDWEAGDGRILIPVIGEDDLGPDGRIANLSILGDELHYHDNRFPLAPGSIEGGPEAVLDLDPNDVLDRQHYQLVDWRRGDSELNYRRFFSITTLAGVRVEDSDVFWAAHEEVARWFTEDLVDGLRVDHPDGLRDPGAYLDDLAELTGGAYVLVEKILEPGEQLPPTWATAGTTGYDALALVDRVLTDPAGQAPLDDLEARLRGGPVDWPQMVHDLKREVATGSLLAETRRIVREMRDLDVAPQHSDDDLVDAVAEVLACFSVYRSYLPFGVEHLDHALAEARSRRPDLGPVLDEVAPVLADPDADPAQRFQQTSGMVMAKGVEDCAFYRYSRLTSLNEVGADPSVFSLSTDDFHARMTERQRDWPDAMTTLSTHDTKRGEDVRARITALAEVPEMWAEALERLLDLVPVPDAGFGSLLWQAVIGAWPASRERLQAYAVKAMREAGDHTGWTDVDDAYEQAVLAAVDAVFDVPEVGQVVEDLVARLARPGWSNALAAKALALTMPGVPDVYQGSELWEQSLVDPDNRREVDFDVRARLLAEIRDGARPMLGDGPDDEGAAKLALTHAALTARRDHPELFATYQPLEATGPQAAHCVAFDRGGAITVATRLPIGLAATGGWGETLLRLPEGTWRDLLSGRTVPGGEVALHEVLGDHPVALLLRAEGPVGPSAPASHRGAYDVWAPHAERLRLVLDADGERREVEMERGSDAWWTPVGELPADASEVDYGYLVDHADTPVPDPRSRRLPHGVHGLSRRFDAAAHEWSDQRWAGRQLAGSTIYELHVGTFTPEGTLDAAIGKLDHLLDIGVDFVELMPVNSFNGTHGWGYDAVAWFAVHEPYGGPAAYQRFVDACHAKGLGVIQDVVHNHFGPSGNYLPMFGPYLKAEGENPWGAVVNFDGEGSAEVRRYVLDSVRMWLEDFHVDGLRLDAVHAIEDSSDPHLLEEMAVEVARISAHQRRPLTLIAESDLNDPHLITPREAGGLGLDAQWSDDFHHAVHVALTGETDGYYADFEPLAALAKVCERGFFHDGTFSSFRGRDHGVAIDTAAMPTWRLVVCSQNHDQIGNRAVGDRITEKLDDDQLAVAALLTLCGPFTPMLFQGEEWAASTPFQFFTSHPEPELGQATAVGRISEFARMGWDQAAVPDPQDPATYERSNLDWNELGAGRHARMLEAYRRLAALRREWPQLTDPAFGATRCEVDEEARLFVMHRGDLRVVVNFADAEARVEVPAGLRVLFETEAGVELTDSSLVLPGHAGALLCPA